MVMPSNPSPNTVTGGATSRFEALAGHAPVSIHRPACLRLRSRLARCADCAAACPTGALQAGAQSLELGARCTGCGRCQAACPTGALAVDGFGAAGAPAATVECFRAPAAAAGVLRVPCLGGLSDGRLLGLCVEAGARPLVLVDRGWCASCESGGAEHPAQAALLRVVALMREAGTPEALLPRLQRAVDAVAARRAPDDDPLQHRGRARRGFFGAIARPATTVARAQGSLPAVASGERRQTLQALQVLVSRHGGRIAPSLIHRVEAAAACQGHRVCAANCPTGALRRYRNDDAGQMGIGFDSAGCIGCGHCVDACPEQALSLQRGAGDLTQGARPLSAFAQRECVDCAARFAARRDDGQTRCARCRASVHLARSAFQTLFGART